MGIKPATFYRWYKEFLSEFRTEKEQNKLHEHDIPINKTKLDLDSKIRVPTLRPENIGTTMAIDEKHINNSFYTILTNGSTGKVALMIDSMNPKYIGESLLKFGNILSCVTTITRDLSPTYQSISTKYFPNATQVADKFHVIAYGIDAVQDLRIKYRQENLTYERKLQAEHAKQYEEYLKKLKENPDEKLPRVNKTLHSVKLSNGETIAEMLARSRYLIFKKTEEWNKNQLERSVILFKEYPLLKEAYDLIESFRNWYEPNGIKDTTWGYMTAETRLMHWMDLAEESKIEEVLNFKGLLERHFEPVLNYHYEHKTNAMAESVNAKIKSALTNNKGARDLDFFHYRLNMIL